MSVVRTIKRFLDIDDPIQDLLQKQNGKMPLVKARAEDANDAFLELQVLSKKLEKMKDAAEQGSPPPEKEVYALNKQFENLKKQYADSLESLLQEILLLISDIDDAEERCMKKGVYFEKLDEMRAYRNEFRNLYESIKGGSHGKLSV